ncbi:MAG TPA: DNA-3-methyladenine glycosylase [Acidobacteriaceae bacterium]|nr:DNA-3-methyladenine glycosylase [Acidobacteriaceae bacterium]
MPETGRRMGRCTAQAPASHADLLPRSFYLDPPETVARGLLGKLLVRPADPAAAGKDCGLAGRIVEVESYHAEADPAAHAFAGKTARNAVLFGAPGHAYIYFIYGMHYCLNVSCEPEGRAGSVLIRALEPISGLRRMMELRWPESPVASEISPALRLGLTSGPGRLCQAFAITRARDNGADFTSPQSSLQILDDGFSANEILVTPRIGIRKAAERPARYLLAGNPYVSGGSRWTAS